MVHNTVCNPNLCYNMRYSTFSIMAVTEKNIYCFWKKCNYAVYKQDNWYQNKKKNYLTKYTSFLSDHVLLQTWTLKQCQSNSVSRERGVGPAALPFQMDTDSAALEQACRWAPMGSSSREEEENRRFRVTLCPLCMCLFFDFLQCEVLQSL